MNRLTDRELAKALKSNCEGLKRAGIEPNMSDLRYIKLAEYENREEHREFDRFYTLKYGEVTANQVAATKYALENRPRKAAKVNLEQIVECAYLLDNEPEQETKWEKNNPSINVDGKNINELIMRRFMERR